MSGPRFGAIEAGGTKFVCAVGTSDGKLLEQVRIPTGAPADTIEQVVKFFRSQRQVLQAIGIASFGPVQLDRSSPHYGFITSTPKSGWQYFDLAGAVSKRLSVSVAFDTDVNAAAEAERRWGAARGNRTFLYITVGTGIGGAAMIDDSILRGLSHPEMGHLLVPHDPIRDPFPGVCPYHGDCLEGLASGPAIEARWQADPQTLPPDHPAWPLEADYLAKACVNWICTVLPEKIVFGGGVMRRELFRALRVRVRDLLNGYLEFPEFAGDLECYLVPAGLGQDAGVLGALLLAMRQAGME